MLIRAHNRDFLDSINGNLGTALGFKKKSGAEISDKPAIIVFVPLKINPKWIPNSQMIPDKLKGPDGLWCELDVVAGGKATEEEPVPEAQDELTERLRGWDKQIWAGSQVALWINRGRGSYSMGTLGAFAKNINGGELGFLTNQHVGNKPGQVMYHPVPWGTRMGVTEKVIEHMRDEEYYGPSIDEPNTFVRVDCAFVRIDAGFDKANINTDLMGVGNLGEVKEISLDDMSIIGQNGDDYTIYTDLLIIGENGIPFSTHGDSGSLIVLDNDEYNPIGLLWGGWEEKLRTGYAQENWTFGIALSRVLKALNIELVSA